MCASKHQRVAASSYSNLIELEISLALAIKVYYATKFKLSRARIFESTLSFRQIAPKSIFIFFRFSYLLPTNDRSNKQKTPVCRKTICPRWEHTLRWDDLTLADLASSCLELTVWDHDRLPGRHSECLGGARFNLGTGNIAYNNISLCEYIKTIPKLKMKLYFILTFRLLYPLGKIWKA